MGLTFQIYFVGNLLLLVFLMKVVVRLLVGTNLRWSWWLSPHLVPSFEGRGPSRVELLIRQILFFLLSVLSWWALNLLPIDWAQYVAALLIWFSTEWLGATVGLLSLEKGLPLIHNEPWKGRGLYDFWGRRWNIWVNGWLRLVSHKLFEGHFMRPISGFILSAIFHELMFALPFHLAFGKKIYGHMTAYFIIQAVGTLIESRWLRNAPSAIIYVWTWAWVIIPAPFFTQGPFLTLFRGNQP